ncbi:response regulator transcription factor [Pedobacter sp. ASV28]|uniref:response regulator transcription factor n=1 Tax=Pedobacter sp. ASV28 TaxID=2795123 RepID=UPI0018EC33A2|nr:helix-turn-helix transcriptional regulator [Pedobacter sp. ASV28]
MQIKRFNDFTFKNHLQQVYYAHDLIEEHEIKKVLSEFARLNIIFNYSAPLLFAIDYTRSEYITMTGGAQLITGHDPRFFLESGLPLLMDIYQKDDFRIYNENIFNRNLNFLKTQPQAEHHKFIFSYNFRVRHQNGKYVPIYQRGCYITSKKTGLPLYSLGMVLDISMFKKDSVMYHSIEKVDVMNGGLNKEMIEESHFFPYEEDKLLSLHERRILAYMSEGFSSKQIADKLKITENTVANHRKNMLKKTNTKNVAELIAFAFKSQLI